MNESESEFSSLSKPEVSSIERPWGSMMQYALNQECTVTLMTVQPGKRLSLQSHTGRAELWVVLDEGAIIEVGEDSRQYMPGDEIWIPRTTQHRLTCAGPRPVRVLEVAFGVWRQTDIQRYADDFGRPSHGE